MIRKSSLVAFASILLLWAGAAIAAGQAGQSAKVAGNWSMTIHTQRGAFNQTMTIQQEGNKIKGTLQGRRGDTRFHGSVDGHNISFTVARQSPRGALTVKYGGTVHGNSMKGTASSSRFSIDWTAKRSASSK
jgi:hypothetical protein